MRRWRETFVRLASGVLACGLPGGLRLFPALATAKGHLFPHEAVFLYWLARDVPGDEPIVEIGSYAGRSTLCMAAGVRRRGSGRVFAVDPHVYETEEALRRNLRRFLSGRTVETVVATSLEFAATWDGPARLVFVDGNHQETSVESDVMAWLPVLKPGGFLLLHDSTGPGAFPGPAAVARRRLTVGAEFDAVGRIGSITWARRSGGVRPWTPRTWGRRTFDPLIRLLKKDRNRPR